MSDTQEIKKEIGEVAGPELMDLGSGIIDINGLLLAEKQSSPASRGHWLWKLLGADGDEPARHSIHFFYKKESDMEAAVTNISLAYETAEARDRQYQRLVDRVVIGAAAKTQTPTGKDTVQSLLIALNRNTPEAVELKSLINGR